MMNFINKSSRLAMVSLGACALLSTTITTAAVEAAAACPAQEQKAACGDAEKAPPRASTAKKSTGDAATGTVIVVPTGKQKASTGAAVKKAGACGETKKKNGCNERKGKGTVVVVEASKQAASDPCHAEKTENADGTLLTAEALDFQLLNLEELEESPRNSQSVVLLQRLQSNADDEITLRINGKTYDVDSIEAAQEILAKYGLREMVQSSDLSFGPAPRTRVEGFGTHGIVDFRQLSNDVFEVHEQPNEMMDLAELSLKVVREKPKAMLGVMLGTIEPEQLETLGLNAQVGVLIAGTLPDTPAAAAGIEEGDIIVAVTVNGDSSRVNLESLRAIVAKQLPGTTMVFQILRNGASIKREVELAKWDDEKLGLISAVKPLITDELHKPSEMNGRPRVEVEEFLFESEDSDNPHDLFEFKNNAHQRLLTQLKEMPGISETELEQLREAFENFPGIGEQFHWWSENGATDFNNDLELNFEFHGAGKAPGEHDGDHDIQSDRHHAKKGECRSNKTLESPHRKMMELRRPEMPQRPQAPRHPRIEREMPNFEMMFERLERRMQKFEQRMEQLLRQQRRLEQRLRQRDSDRKAGNTGTDA